MVAFHGGDGSAGVPPADPAGALGRRQFDLWPARADLDAEADGLDPGHRYLALDGRVLFAARRPGGIVADGRPVADLAEVHPAPGATFRELVGRLDLYRWVGLCLLAAAADLV